MFGRFREAYVHVRAVLCHFWKNLGSAAEGMFGRRTCLWWHVWPPKLAPESLDFRLWRAVSAAKPAAKHP